MSCARRVAEMTAPLLAKNASKSPTFLGLSCICSTAPVPSTFSSRSLILFRAKGRAQPHAHARTRCEHTHRHAYAHAQAQARSKLVNTDADAHAQLTPRTNEHTQARTCTTPVTLILIPLCDMTEFGSDIQTTTPDTVSPGLYTRSLRFSRTWSAILRLGFKCLPSPEPLTAAAAPLCRDLAGLGTGAPGFCVHCHSTPIDEGVGGRGGRGDDGVSNPFFPAHPPALDAMQASSLCTHCIGVHVHTMRTCKYLSLQKKWF